MPVTANAFGFVVLRVHLVLDDVMAHGKDWRVLQPSVGAPVRDGLL